MVGINQVTLTTNGVLLQQHALELHKAGIDSININMPALTREGYRSITNRDEFFQVMEGIRLARNLGIPLKLNCVSRKTMKDAELYEYCMLAMQYPIHVRFIEMMPLGQGAQFETYGNDRILQRINEIFQGIFTPSTLKGNGPATYYEGEGFQGKIGFISAISHQFCDACNRIRLTADGDLKLCLNYEKGISLRDVIRYQKPEKLEEAMRIAIYDKPKKHCFYDTVDIDMEQRKMVQIGG
jgi:cyclic pyranopterin phosphate synthase